MLSDDVDDNAINEEVISVVNQVKMDPAKRLEPVEQDCDEEKSENTEDMFDMVDE